MKLLLDRNFLFLFLIGLGSRLFLAFLPGQVFDMQYWNDWTFRLHQVGFDQFYSPTIRTDYLPGYLYILYGLGFLKTTFNIDNNLFLYALKLPGIIAEMILAAVVYLSLIKSSNFKFALIGSSFVLFNPAFIFNSAVWGQIDGLLTLFLLLATNFLKNKTLIWSSVMLSTAFLIKPQTIMIFPAFILYTTRNLTSQHLWKLILPFFLIILIASLPFFPYKPFHNLINLIINTASQYPYTSLNAYNFWGIIGFWIPDEKEFMNITFQNLGFFIFMAYWVVIAYFYFKKKLSLYALVTLAALGFFFLLTRVHERYLYPALVFLIILITGNRSILLFFLTVMINLLHFWNLYYVYVRYNGVYLSIPETGYNFLSANSQVLSLISTIIFIMTVIVIIIKHYAPNSKN